MVSSWEKIVVSIEIGAQGIRFYLLNGRSYATTGVYIGQIGCGNQLATIYGLRYNIRLVLNC